MTAQDTALAWNHEHLPQGVEPAVIHYLNP